jgi:phosphoglycerate dehydrogenase-like enzyme
VRTLDALAARIAEPDVLVVSGLWRNELVDRAERLRFVQSISAGTDQYDREALRARGIHRRARRARTSAPLRSMPWRCCWR